MINTIIFDLGGTLVYPNYKNGFEFVRLAINSAGIHDNEISLQNITQLTLEYVALYSNFSISSFTDYVSYLSSIVQRHCESIDRIKRIRLVYHLLHEELFLELDANEEELLSELKSQGYKLILLSNWPIIYPFVHERLKLSEYFDDFYVSAFQGKQKPSVSLLYRLVEDSGIVAKNSIMVGNSLEFDLNPAQKVGMHVIKHCKSKDSIVDLKQKIIAITKGGI